MRDSVALCCQLSCMLLWCVCSLTCADQFHVCRVVRLCSTAVSLPSLIVSVTEFHRKHTRNGFCRIQHTTQVTSAAAAPLQQCCRCMCVLHVSSTALLLTRALTLPLMLPRFCCSDVCTYSVKTVATNTSRPAEIIQTTAPCNAQHANTNTWHQRTNPTCLPIM